MSLFQRSNSGNHRMPVSPYLEVQQHFQDGLDNLMYNSFIESLGQCLPDRKQSGF